MDAQPDGPWLFDFGIWSRKKPEMSDIKGKELRGKPISKHPTLVQEYLYYISLVANALQVLLNLQTKLGPELPLLSKALIK